MPTSGRWDGASQLFSRLQSVETMELNVLNNGEGHAACEDHDKALKNWDLVSMPSFTCGPRLTSIGWLSRSA